MYFEEIMAKKSRRVVGGRWEEGSGGGDLGVPMADFC